MNGQLIIEHRDVGALTDAEVEAHWRSIEAAHRSLAALETEVLAEATRRRLWKRDGHQSVNGLVRLMADESEPEVTGRVQLARLVEAHPGVGDDLHQGRYSVGAARRLARAMAHPRAGRHFDEYATLLRDLAARLPYPDLCRALERWELLVDPDGADQDARSIEERRRVSMTCAGQEFVVQGQGDAVAGEAISRILQAFVKVEFDKDWAWTVERHGDAACAALMPRTDAQRRFDAFHHVFLAAAPTPSGAQAPEPVVNVVGDATTVVLALGRLFGIDVADPRSPEELLQARCETASGVPVAPETLARVLLSGHVRRVVCDAAGVVIDLGRRQRFFTGAARTAASLLHTRCIYPGCRVPVAKCQIDHLHEWQDGGPTDQVNAGPECDWHNLFKTFSGYRLERQADGRFRTFRPDGSEVI